MFHFNILFKVKNYFLKRKKADKTKEKPSVTPLPYIATVYVGELKTFRRKDLRKSVNRGYR